MNKFFKLHDNGNIRPISENEYRAHNETMRALYGEGFTLLLDYGQSYCAVDTANVRRTAIRDKPWHTIVVDELQNPFTPELIAKIKNTQYVDRTRPQYIKRPKHWGAPLSPPAPLTDAQQDEFKSAWLASMAGRKNLGFIVPFEGDAIPYNKQEVLPGKGFRVFYDAGVYEWYTNIGPGPLHLYRKRGTLWGAYNARAGIWTRAEYL